MAGFDARRTLSHAAIMDSAAREEPFARALMGFKPIPSTSGQSIDLTSIDAAMREARVDFSAGRLSEGVGRLMPFLEFEEVTPRVLTAMAEACLAAGHRSEALTIALRCLEGDPVNSRALCIAGECELDLGNRKSAQMYLAKCARVARKMPDHIEDMRTAQRLLLRMHFA